MVRLFLILMLAAACRAENTPALALVPLDRLSDRGFTALAQRALAVRAADWKHAETEHFILHFFDAGTAAAVSVEVEFYYRVIAAELGRDTALWERKAHVFLFHEEKDWRGFQTGAALDPWSGGLHSGGTLFLLRNPGWKARAQTLPHEVAHLVFERFVGAGVPLWLNEGFAEYAAGRCMAAFYRARGFDSRPRVTTVPEERYVPVAALTSAAAYPQDAEDVAAFYHESEKLVRFLSAADKRAFLSMLDAMGKGARLESALAHNFGNRFPSLDALEREFKPYATNALRPN